jgi:nucleoside-diphosphate-sugar epimerase
MRDGDVPWASINKKREVVCPDPKSNITMAIAKDIPKNIEIKFRPKRVFLTGANGFLGKAIMRVLINEKIPVVCYTRKKFTYGKYSNVDFITGELSDTEKIESSVKGCDSIIHCAGIVDFDDESYERSHFVHVEALKNLYEAAKKTNVKRFVYVSSHWTIGFSLNKNYVCSEKNSLCPDNRTYNVYQKTKLEGERFLEKNASPRVDYVIVNPTQIWGLENRHDIFWENIEKARNQRISIVPAGGTNVVNVDDIAKGILLALENGAPNERYILGGENITFKELSYKFLKATNKKGIVIEIPGPLIRSAIDLIAPISKLFSGKLYGKLAFIKTVAAYKFYSSEKAREEMGYYNSFDVDENISQILKKR